MTCNPCSSVQLTCGCRYTGCPAKNLTKMTIGPAGWSSSFASAIHFVWSGHLLHLDWPCMADGQVSMTLTRLTSR